MARREATTAIRLGHVEFDDRPLSELLPPLPYEDSARYTASLKEIELSKQRALLWLAGVRVDG